MNFRNAFEDHIIGAFLISRPQPRPDDTDWTVAEIKACCCLLAMLDVSRLEAA